MQPGPSEQNLEPGMAMQEQQQTHMTVTKDVPNEERVDSPSFQAPGIQCCVGCPLRDRNNAIRFKFMNEGAANAVFEIHPSLPEEELCFIFKGPNGETMPRATIINKVLRISKGNPKTLKYQEIMDGFRNQVLPLFQKSELPRARDSLYIPESYEEFVMDHQGVAICSEALHVLLTKLHAHCPINKHIEPHHLEERGILLPNMSSRTGKSFSIEFKPKWLAQSPSAPQDAYLCRTCAITASRKPPNAHILKSYICPLKLSAGSVPAIEQFLRESLEMAKLDADKKAIVFNRASAYLTSGPGRKIIQHLHYLQTNLDEKGVVNQVFTREEKRRLRLAMTLRDCSLFIRVPHGDEDAPVEGKLVDLDFKSFDKVDEWVHKEVGLINGGWYLNTHGRMERCLIAEGWRQHVPWYF